jgi:alanyl-tRNA synthetase
MTQKITTNEVRTKFLKHFEKQGHVVIPSSRLVPENDPTTLFTGSGMQPMVPYLLGQKHAMGTRLADSQKCFRSQDIEEAGDNRHTTFFEMLGNWSLGDYGKVEQINWMWEFIIQEIKIDPKNLYFTCFKGAEEIGIPRDTFAAEQWQKLFTNVGIEAKIGENPEVDGMQAGEKIFYYGAKKNWWSRVGVPQNMPLGEPGGPDSEMFYDFDPTGEKQYHAKSPFKNDLCHPNCDCGRFMEIGNNVFMEYVRTDNGFEFLKNKNIDHGSGLERFVAAANNDNDVFNIDVFANAIKKLEELSGKKYNPIQSDTEVLGVDKLTQSFRVIADHLRGATFFIADGIYPGNKDQGYFVRRLMRRAIRHGRNLGISENFCKIIAEFYISYHGELYTELVENKNKVLEIMDEEENQFKKTLANGERELDKYFSTYSATGGEKIISGKIAFDLLQSYGYPVELTQEIGKEKGFAVDMKEFEELKAKHSQDSRAGSENKFKGGLANPNDEMVVKYHTATHLLHQALKNVLGEDANQRGSNITPERLRFDFSYPTKMTPEQIEQTERLVNEWIEKDLTVRREEINKNDAEARKPIHLFGEKYGDVVSIYTIGDGKVRGLDATSVEFCGGPHVEHTGQIGEGGKKFKITKEEAVSAGVRRIKAVVN